jgi:hypothetical protein
VVNVTDAANVLIIIAIGSITALAQPIIEHLLF